MPTADDYEALARRFDARADAVRQLGTTLATTVRPDVLSGPHATTLDLALQASAANLATLGRRLRANAATCRRRAHVCRTYAEDVRRYRSALMGLGHAGAITPPARPAPWAEVG